MERRTILKEGASVLVPVVIEVETTRNKGSATGTWNGKSVEKSP